MSKRPINASASPGLKNHEREVKDEISESHLADMGEFEDQFEDEFESEDEVIEAGADGEPDPDEDDNGGDGNAMDVDNQVYIPSRRTLGKGEILEPDPSAYHMLHSMNVTWPCLSFDVLRDNLGEERRGYPATAYLVAGTQANRARDNEVLVMKLSSLHKMHQGRENEDEESDDEDDDNTEDDPILETRSLPTMTTTNRIRASPHASTTGEYLAAQMCESGEVNIWNITPHFTSFDTPGTVIPKEMNKPVAAMKMHKGVEGYAIDWSPLEKSGKLLTGDNSGKIFVTTRTESGGWKTDGVPYTGHTSSVEEIQWSPIQPNIFCSASADGTVKIWDTRSKKHKPALSVDVSSSDINVASWSKKVHHLLATGADDGVWGIWDMRTFPSAAEGKAVTASAQFTFHQQPITSIEFHPSDESIVGVASADNTVTLWDLSVELDDEESKDTGGVEDIPPQLLFVHYMKEVKEMHWHGQISGTVVATGGEGFNIFKTISV